MTAAGVSLQLCGNMFKAGCCWSKGREGSGGLINKLEMSGFLGKGVRNHLDLVSLVRLGFPCLTMTKSLPSASLVRYFKDHSGIMPTPHPFQNRWMDPISFASALPWKYSTYNNRTEASRELRKAVFLEFSKNICKRPYLRGINHYTCSTFCPPYQDPFRSTVMQPLLLHL